MISSGVGPVGGINAPPSALSDEFSAHAAVETAEMYPTAPPGGDAHTDT